MGLRARNRQNEREDDRLDQYYHPGNERVLKAHVWPKQSHGVCRVKGCGRRTFLTLPAGTCQTRCTKRLLALMYVYDFLGVKVR